MGGAAVAPPPAGGARLDPLFRPRAVAVVGASPNPSFVSGILRNLLRPAYGYQGRVVAVNPRYDRVLDAPCYPSVADVPHALDLVIVGVAHRLVPDVLEQCATRAVRAVAIVSSGFAETGGGAGRHRQVELLGWARRTGIPLNGPNCLGLMNARVGMVALPTVFERLSAGAVGAVLQSGMMAPSVLVPLLARGIGLGCAVTTGNEADLDAADYLRYMVEDDETRVIACFTEQIRSPEAFAAACEEAARRRKPVVMLKIGRSEGSRRAALAHTGSLVGEDAVVDVVLRRLGVTRVASVDELVEAVAAFHARRLPRGPGVAAVSVSGGAVGLLVDLAPAAGVDFPALPSTTAERLQKVVPEFGSVGNPLDLTGQAVYETTILEGALDALAETPDIDVVVWGRPFPAGLDRQSPAGQALERAVARHLDVVFLVLALVGGHLHASQNPDLPMVDPTTTLDGVPFLQGSEAGLRAVAALVRYAAFQRARAAGEVSSPRRVVPGRASEARALVRATGGRPLAEREGKAVLACYGIPVPPERLASDVDAAERAAAEIGYPVALKVEAPGLLHKTEAGAVRLGVGDAAELREGFALVQENVRRAAPAVAIRGVLVQAMAPPGTEVILGMTQDPQFGPVVACGLGGIWVETLKDVQLLLPPVSLAEARAALERLRGFALLQGARGRPPADLDALVDALSRFAELVEDLRDLVREIDVNPLIVGEVGRGASAVDCLIVPAAPGAP